MKRILLSILFTPVVLSCFAQSTGINYQAVIRDLNGEIITEETITLRADFLSGDSITLYSESHELTTDSYGQINTVLGTGTPLEGNFNTLTWGTTSSNDVMLEMFILENAQWAPISFEKLQHVPFGYYAERAGIAAFADRADIADEAELAYSAEAYNGTTLEIGTASRTNVNTFLTVKGNLTGAQFNGMYVDTPDETGVPFYGFATGGVPKTWMSYEPTAQVIDFYNNGSVMQIGQTGIKLPKTGGGVLVNSAAGVVASDVILPGFNGVTMNGTLTATESTWLQKDLQVGGPLVIGGGANYNSVTDLTLNASSSGFNGMYIANSESTGQPFYGYAVTGQGTAYHYITSGAKFPAIREWRLNVSGNRFTVAADGRVGINTTNIESTLHIKQSPTDVVNTWPFRTGTGPFKNLGLRLESGDDSRWWNIACGSNSSAPLNEGANLHFSSNASSELVATIKPTGEYLQLSDSTMKENIQQLDPVLDKVMALRPSKYTFKDTPHQAEDFGFLAQEVKEVFPNMVEQVGQKLTLSYSEFAPVAIKAIQEQQELIELLRQEIAELKANLK